MHGHGEQRHEQDPHRRQYRPSLARVPDHAPEGVGEPGRDEQYRQHLQEVGQRTRVLVRMRGVGIQKAAAVGAELLDALLGGDRAHGQGLGAARLDGGHVLISAEVLDHPLRDEHERQQHRDGQQDVERRARHIHPEVADGGGAVACQTPDERDRDHDAARGGEEVLHRQPRHLREITHRRLAGVALPVGVGDEAHRGVEGGIAREVGEFLRIQRQPRLQALQGVDGQGAEEVEHQKRNGVLLPARLRPGVDAAEAVDPALERRPGTQGPSAASLEDPGDVQADGFHQGEQQAQEHGNQGQRRSAHQKASGFRSAYRR